jgi:AraC-like DNA-binding protein
MYLTSLPDHSQPGFDEHKHFSMFGNANVIFNAQSNKARCDNHVGCLSLKTVFAGEEWYGISGRSVAVRPGMFLLLNDRQDYSCRINTSSVHTISVFFSRDLARAVMRDASTSTRSIIDDPFVIGDALPEFFQSLHQLNGEIRRDLITLIGSLETHGYNSNHAEELLVSLLHNILQTHRHDLAALRNVHGVKVSTQKEIYKRLCIARDMLHSLYHEEISLKAIAATSSLSIPQLVRQFKTTFGVTPHKYLVNIRLQHAADLLRSTDAPINEIAMRSGFDHPGSFARAFFGKYKIQPGIYRSGNTLI